MSIGNAIAMIVGKCAHDYVSCCDFRLISGLAATDGDMGQLKPLNEKGLPPLDQSFKIFYKVFGELHPIENEPNLHPVHLRQQTPDYHCDSSDTLCRPTLLWPHLPRPSLQYLGLDLVHHQWGMGHCLHISLHLYMSTNFGWMEISYGVKRPELPAVVYGTVECVYFSHH
ncbi:MAG: hypothetical protein EOO38_16770 [Cytophagaceae bacterium]|nr:MAG: hypothetical protein EOO38_16770 [Cytophagaceae bacterium]